MTTLSIHAPAGFAEPDIAPTTALGRRVSARLTPFVELTKPRITAMVMFSTAIGYWIAVRDVSRIAAFVHALVGTALLASGTGALNQWLERDTDALMRRTRRRPIPSGRVAPVEGLAFGAALSALGVLELVAGTNVLAAAAGFLTCTIYLFVYTPLKRRSSICMLAGAAAGAMPPTIGCLAANPYFLPPVISLFAILFVWQMPHAYAIALMYRDDYERGGLRMLPASALYGLSAGRHIVFWSMVLVPASLTPVLFGMAGVFYAASAIVLGLAFVLRCTRLLDDPSIARARTVLVASVLYLPLILIALLLTHGSVAR